MRMKRFVVVFLFGVALLLIVGFFVAENLLERNTGKIIPMVANAVEHFGLQLDEASIQDADLGFPMEVRWNNVRGRIETSEDSALARKAGFDFEIGEIVLTPISLNLQSFNLEMRDVFAKSVYVLHPTIGPEIGGLWLKISELSKQFEYTKEDPLENFKEIAKELESLMKIGKSATPFSVNGSLGFTLNKRKIRLDCVSEERDGYHCLRAEREGVKALVDALDVSLTDAELEVISKYPIQAPQMLNIRSYATEVSLDAASHDGTVPQDAYRHVLWSYLLAKRFGPELATEVTDAHEIGNTTNTEAEHRMDYHNNEVGFRYAAEGRREGDILHLTKTDPDVVRRP